jgi:hypothetical protein
MNYKQIHDKLINYCKNSTPKMRLEKRNKNDERLNKNSLYVEIHHIIPRSLEGKDDFSNLVEVLPEEHIFLHMIRYKIYKKREDALAVRCMLNGFSFHPNNVKQNLHIILNKKLRMGYAWIRTHSQTIRKTEGWHTENGLKRISEARKGKIPVKDKDTGEFIGAVSNKHPNVLSGKWVHHTKGRKISEEERTMRKEIGMGQNNNNASGLSEEYFIQKGIEAFQEFGIILPWPAMIKLGEKRGFKWIKSNASRFNGKGTRGYYSILENITGAKVNTYIRNKHFKNNPKLKELYNIKNSNKKIKNDKNT